MSLTWIFAVIWTSSWLGGQSTLGESDTLSVGGVAHRDMAIDELTGPSANGEPGTDIRAPVVASMVKPAMPVRNAPV